MFAIYHCIYCLTRRVYGCERPLSEAYKPIIKCLTCFQTTPHEFERCQDLRIGERPRLIKGGL